MLGYFFNLDFYWDRLTLGPALQNKKLIWTATVYFLLSLGIFSRQITAFPKVDLNTHNVTRSVLIASFVIGFALLPPVMRWISKRTKKPTWEHTLAAFSIGFFIDLSTQILST